MASYHPDKQTPANQLSTASGLPDALPIPRAEWLNHSQQLVARISDRIRANGGKIGFDQFMQYALYEPGLGYYSASAPKFGETGDFVTAPELSPLFGECLANFCRSVFSQGCATRVLEFGAGSGKLCGQLLENCAEVKQYLILELSAELRQRQQIQLEARLPAETFNKIVWLDRLPERFDGLLLANEVLDAMPVNVVTKQKAWLELGVSEGAEGLSWCEFATVSPVVSQIQSIESRLCELTEGYLTEVNLNLQPWSTALAELPGEKACLIIDYGEEQAEYYRSSRPRGSLRCYYQHHQHEDPFLYPGLQDITADVDFDAVADAAEMAGFELCGFTAQGTFLLNHGLIEVASRLVETADTVKQLAIAQQVKTLTLPAEMGQRFKVLLLSQGLSLQALDYTTSGLIDG